MLASSQDSRPQQSPNLGCSGISLVSLKTKKSPLLVLVALAIPARASYSIVSRLSGQSFFHSFQWQTITDPTHGRVCVVCLQFSEMLIRSSGKLTNVLIRLDDYSGSNVMV
ncbi:hypothetical protein J3R83DRAFT_8533 [Lanmaoa asiatica]|nr:hypothetical protein J3R83DRAFT_8533 [Lanmaoa asiatica]